MRMSLKSSRKKDFLKTFKEKSLKSQRDEHQECSNNLKFE